MIGSGGEDLGETREGGSRASSQQPMPNAQPSKSPIKARATVDFEKTKGNHPRDSLNKRASTAKNAIQLMQHVIFKDLTPTTWNFLQQNFESVATYIIDTEEERKKTRENASTNLRNGHTGGTATWAAIAAQALRPRPTATEEGSAGGKKLRELVVRVEDAMEREETKAMLAEHILQKFQSSKHAETSQLVAARRLQNGDILLQAATVESRERLERNTGWEKQLFKSAKILKQTFPVLIHGVRLDAVPEGQEQQAVERITRQNEKYHPLLGISRVSWPKWAKTPKENGSPKQYSSLLVELLTPEAANEVVEKGLVEGYQLKTCTRYNRAIALLQCFKCCQYGHISSRCTNPVKCGTCAGNHDTRDHQGPEKMAPSCAACGKKRHTAWHPDCKVRQKEKEKSSAKLASMASKYPVRARFEQNRTSTPISATLDGDGYQIVTRKRKALGELAEATLNMNASKSKAGKQGRPPLSARPTDKEPGQQIIQFLSPATEFTGTPLTPKPAFGLVLEAVRESAETGTEATPPSSV